MSGYASFTQFVHLFLSLSGEMCPYVILGQLIVSDNNRVLRVVYAVSLSSPLIPGPATPKVLVALDLSSIGHFTSGGCHNPYLDYSSPFNPSLFAGLTYDLPSLVR